MRSAKLRVRPTKPSLGPVPERCTIAYLTNPANLVEILYRTESISDSEFDDLVHKIGGRLATLILRKTALSGDTKALDLYLRRVDQWKAERRLHQRFEARQVSPDPFEQPARVQGT